MHRLREITLMAHRNRQQSVRAEQLFDAADRPFDIGPAFPEESVVRGESMVVGDQRH